MTVAELIEELQRMPPYLPILVQHVDSRYGPGIDAPSLGTTCSSVQHVDRNGTYVFIDTLGVYK